MWKPIETPGEWLIFLQREDIKSLPIMEARKKYMQEQLLFEAYENNLNTINTINTTTSAPASAAAGGGGLRKFKYPAEFKLSNGVDADKRGVYTRVAISDLKRYWVDNFTDARGGGFTVPPPSIPSNIGSDFFFIKDSGGVRGVRADIITWGSLGRGRQRGQWTYSEYINTANDCYTQLDRNDKWVTIGFGSTNLSTPAGKFSINDVVGDGGKGGTCKTHRNTYVLEENKPSTLPEIISFAREGGSADGYTGDYSRNGVDNDGNPIWIKNEGRDIYNIYYSMICGGWKVDGGEFKFICNQRIKANSTVEEGPLGTYTYSDPRGGSYTYTATRGVPPPPPPAGSLTVTGATSSDTNYVGNYIKDPSSGTGQDAIYIREDNVMQVYYNTTCAMWRIDNNSGGIPIKVSCGTWTGNPTGNSPLGTYQVSMVKAPATGTYTVAQN